METFILKVAGNKIKKNLDNKVTYHGRKRLQIPRSGNMSLLRLSGSKLALASSAVTKRELDPRALLRILV